MDKMIEKVIMFGLVLGIGMIAAITKRIGSNVRDALPTLILQITSPLMIYTAIAKLTPEDGVIQESLTITAIGFVVLCLHFFIGHFYAKTRKLGEDTKGLQIALMTFSNVIFLAYPLFEALYGVKGIMYAMFFYLASDALFWTIGSVVITNHKGTISEKIKHIITGPVFIAFVLGLVSMATGIKPPAIIMDPLEGLGKTTTYTSLLFIGMTLPLVDFKSIFMSLDLYIILFVKMLVYPILIALLLYKVFNFGLSNMAMNVIVLQVAMPAMTSITVLAKEYKQNYQFSVGVVFISTVFCLLSLLINFKIIELLGGSV